MKERIEKVKINTISVSRLKKWKIEVIDRLHQKSVKFSYSLP